LPLFSRIVQFSRCSLYRFQRFVPRQATYLLYHTFGSLSSLFSNFFQVFSDFSLLKRFTFIRPVPWLPPDRFQISAPLPSLCFIQKALLFSQDAVLSGLSLSLSRPTALLLYHAFSILSSTFSAKQNSIFYLNFMHFAAYRFSNAFRYFFGFFLRISFVRIFPLPARS